MADTVINAEAKIGRHCIANTGAVVEHNNQIGDFVHVSVGAKLAGNVRVGDKTWIRIGVAVSNNISICEMCVIGGGNYGNKGNKKQRDLCGSTCKKIV